jgi:hypothetical protein
MAIPGGKPLTLGPLRLVPWYDSRIRREIETMDAILEELSDTWVIEELAAIALAMLSFRSNYVRGVWAIAFTTGIAFGTLVGVLTRFDGSEVTGFGAGMLAGIIVTQSILITLELFGVIHQFERRRNVRYGKR